MDTLELSILNNLARHRTEKEERMLETISERFYLFRMGEEKEFNIASTSKYKQI